MTRRRPLVVLQERLASVAIPAEAYPNFALQRRCFYTAFAIGTEHRGIDHRGHVAEQAFWRWWFTSQWLA